MTRDMNYTRVKLLGSKTASAQTPSSSRNYTRVKLLGSKTVVVGVMDDIKNYTRVKLLGSKTSISELVAYTSELHPCKITRV